MVVDGHELSKAVAIIAMTGRFPGAATVEALWANVLARRCAITPVSEAELRAEGVASELFERRDYVRSAAPLTEDVALFDARFFGISDHRARLMDPQQRMFLECAWEALELGGYSTRRPEPRIGVFAGTAANQYLLQNVIADPACERGTCHASQDLELGSNKDHVSLLTAYSLGLTGPAITLQSCCSTSLLAVHVAIRSLLDGECDLALAGGVALRLPQRAGYQYQPGGILSPSGRCRPFDARADGTVFGSGVGVVVLKPFAEAVEDGDSILAVILGSAVNNDGARKVGYAAPSVVGQREVIEEALEVAGVDHCEVSYVEAHGTGTAIGDPVEIQALREAHARRVSERATCAVSTIKANVGHLDVAAGVVGLIHAAQVLRHRVVPPLAGFQTENPALALAAGPFFVPRQPTPLRGHRPCAAVSSFGVGGTNVHVILTAPPPSSQRRFSPVPVVAISARSSRALDVQRERVLDFVRAASPERFGDLVYTLQVGRCAFERRLAVPAVTREALIAQLESARVSSDREAVSPAIVIAMSEVPASVGQEIVAVCPELGRRLRGSTFATALLSVLEEAGLRPDLQIPERGLNRAEQLELEQLVASPGGVLLLDLHGRDWPGVEPSRIFRLIERSPADQWLGFVSRAFELGAEVDFSCFYGAQHGSRIALPTYPFTRERHWIAAPHVEQRGEGERLDDDDAATEQVHRIVAELAPQALSSSDLEREFVELGFDSLTLSQLVSRLARELEFRVSVVEIVERYPTPSSLLEHVAAAQREARGRGPAELGSASALGPFRPTRHAGTDRLTASQRAYLAELTERVCAATPASKQLAASSRGVLCDPRSIAGFDPRWKEIVYPIVADECSGSSFVDIDGNRYIDMVMGFGAHYLGHAPPFVTEAVARQLERGYGIGPQTPLAAEVAQLITELTGTERVAYCNTGSEAVAAALRVARTATNKDGVVLFAHSYHGGLDSVLGRPSPRPDDPPVPISPGIPTSALRDTHILPYNCEAALGWISQHADRLAAVLVEPVQSRVPQVVPVEFLHALRQLCSRHQIALVFDEVITGFRCHLGGAQALFGIQADLVLYGKVIGGGLPIGVIAGRAPFMDHLDGGVWRYGDGSGPSAARTFHAGTFVRHPLALAAARSALEFLRQQGPTLQFNVTHRVLRLRDSLNEIFARKGVAVQVHSFASFIAHQPHPSLEYFDLLFPLLRTRGVYASEGRLGHFSIAHSDDDLRHIVDTYDVCLQELIDQRLLPTASL